MFVAARNEHLPSVLGMVSVHNFTPILANILTVRITDKTKRTDYRHVYFILFKTQDT